MGHHPIIATPPPDVAAAGGISPFSWLLIMAGMVVVIYVVYNWLKKR